MRVGAASGRNWKRLSVNVVCELTFEEEEKWGSHTLQERVIKTDLQKRVIKTEQTLRRGPAGPPSIWPESEQGGGGVEMNTVTHQMMWGLGGPPESAWILLSVWYEREQEHSAHCGTGHWRDWGWGRARSIICSKDDCGCSAEMGWPWRQEWGQEHELGGCHRGPSKGCGP